MMPDDRITVEQLVRIRVPRHELLIELTLEEANELFLGLQDVQRGILALRPLRLPMPARIPIVPTDEGLDRLAADLGVAIPITEPVNETGPTLQDDIERMVESSKAADARAQHVRQAWGELVQRYPGRTVGQQVNQLASRFDLSAADVRAILGDVVPHKETDQVRAVRLWGQYREKYPQERPNATVSRVKSHMKQLTADEVRALLRSGGIDVPEPMSIEETAANARRAQQQMRESEPKAPLLDRFPEPPANLDVLDALALTWEILDESRPQISSYVTTRVGLAATMAYKSAVEAFKPEYEAMAPFARRDFKSAIAARWHKERAA